MHKAVLDNNVAEVERLMEVDIIEIPNNNSIKTPINLVIIKREICQPGFPVDLCASPNHHHHQYHDHHQHDNNHLDHHHHHQAGFPVDLRDIHMLTPLHIACSRLAATLQ